MSFFPLTAYPTSTSSFSPLFRLLDDFEQHQSGNAPSSHNHHTRSGLAGGLRFFTPKFDVKELADTYELHGELPGIEQNDVEIEFTDAQTLTIKGRTDKSFTRGTPPAGFIEGEKQPAQLTEGKENGKHTVPHKASVEDAEEAEKNESAGASTVVKSSGAKKEVAETNSKKAEVKYWVSERSIGEFSRTFTFPGKVDQDGVKASMKNGVLSIVVPKSKKAEGRKILIE